MFRTAGAWHGEAGEQLEQETTVAATGSTSCHRIRRKKGVSEGSLSFKFFACSFLCFFPLVLSQDTKFFDLKKFTMRDEEFLDCSIDQLSELPRRLHESIAGGICCQIGAELSVCAFPCVPRIAMP